jgi:hypothetical protein
MTIGHATKIVNNLFSRMIDRMNRETMAVTNIANVILKVFDGIESGIEKLIDMFDGWENAIRLVGIAIGIALGAKAIAIVTALGVAQWKAFLIWNLIALAIVAAAVIIEDIYVWLKGGESVTGRILEKFKEWGTALEEGFAKAETAVLETIMGWSKALYNMFVETIPRAIRDAWNYVKELPSVAWEGVKSGAKNFASGTNMGFNAVSQAQIATAGRNPVSMSNTTNVNLTVPPGTTSEQAKFIDRAANQSFSKINRGQLRAIDMAAQTP